MEDELKLAKERSDKLSGELKNVTKQKNDQLLFIFLFLSIALITCAYNLFTLYNRYIECYANEKNHTTVITTLDGQLKQCKENVEKEQKMCKEDILGIKKEKDILNNALQLAENININCDVQLKHCKLHYHDCKDQLHIEETKRKNLEKTLDNATLENSRAKKICEIDVRSIRNERDDCEIRVKGLAECQEDLHECNRKKCYIF